MTATTPIADMVEALPTGATREEIVRVIRAVEMSRATRRPEGRSDHGTRLPPDWQPSQSEIDYALSRGLAIERVQIEAEKFKNYWTAKSGKDATKRDWAACWRNWILTASEARYGAANKPSARAHTVTQYPPAGTDPIVSGMGSLARRRMQERQSERARGGVPDSPDAAPQLDFGRGAT
jgi:hypothetical protein